MPELSEKTLHKTLPIALGAAAAFLLAACAEPQNTETPAETAKNVILFIGDGMGVATVTAARIFDGQSQGLRGEEHWLAFEKFPNVALVKTYNTNQQVADSAGTATAMMTGQKTRAGVINIGPDARRRNCEEALAQPASVHQRDCEAARHGRRFRDNRARHPRHAGDPLRPLAGTRLGTDLFLPEADWYRGCRDIAHQLVHSAPATVWTSRWAAAAVCFSAVSMAARGATPKTIWCASG